MNEHLLTLLIQCESYQSVKTGSPLPKQGGNVVCFVEHPTGLAQAELVFELVTAALPVKLILMTAETVPGAARTPGPPAVDMELHGMVRDAAASGANAKLGWGVSAQLQEGGSIAIRSSGRDAPHNPGIDIANSTKLHEWMKSRYGDLLSKSYRQSKAPRMEVKFVGS